MEHKLFTLDEANALLPQLKEDLRKLQQVTEQFEGQLLEYQKTKMIHKQAFTQTNGKHDPFFEMESKLEFMKMETDLLIENFKRKGVLLKMIQPGLIDFPAMLDGEEILICWKEGEESAAHYHGWHEGFIGRKPFPNT
ncbi:DUF2203 domain-containing protein [Paenibacillus alkaliterrae]|uniref:DUF2203 domain-containing protein n=1 Tax=Paenibacillus alkaliterrae TaxID=320909 RepID=UPI001F2C3BAD|nr:DUF2203 domain-containing protein [Paenibacillus alkaliterrae]MCF2939433.1 DUF2203 domain-containing protein [Paenibacillus alkaliterrae]